MREYDYLIIGAGFYGLFAASVITNAGARVLLIEKEKGIFQRASYINQARVHQGYHYPRSMFTALKTKEYFDEFNRRFENCIRKDFTKVYALSKYFSLTNAEQFERFCSYSGIPFRALPTNSYFKDGVVEAVYETREYTYDFASLSKQIYEEINQKCFELKLNDSISSVGIADGWLEMTLRSGEKVKSPRVLNASYAGINELNALFNADLEKVKYELCEVILVKGLDRLCDIGITLMDGPFFSIMPFGKTKYHSLTSVSHTPHATSPDPFPTFQCQKRSPYCTPRDLQNCNSCPVKPRTSWNYVRHLTGRYLSDDVLFNYVESLFSVKVVPKTAELDDGRPTLLRRHNIGGTYRSVLSGKINTVFDLEEELLSDLSS